MKVFNWHRIKPDLWLGAMQKCGTRSIIFGIENHRNGTTYENLRPSKMRGKVLFMQPGNGHRVAVIRHPVEKFCSLWRCQARDAKPGIMYGKENRRKITPERLFEMCALQDNSHYLKQSCLLPFADEVIKFERLPEWWLENAGYEMPSVNSTSILPSDDEALTDNLLARVAEFYAEDMEAYENAV